MADMSNTSGSPDFQQNNGARRQTKNLFKPPFVPDAPVQNTTPPAQSYAPYANSGAGTSNRTANPPSQGGFQVPPFMLADMQNAPSSFPSTDPVVNFNNRGERVKIDTLKRVALSSRNSLQRNIAAARPQQQLSPTTNPPYTNNFMPQRMPISAPLNPMQPAALLPKVEQFSPRVSAASRPMPPHSKRAKMLLLIFVLGSILPIIIGIGNEISLLMIVQHGTSGVQHLLHVRTIVNDLKGHTSNLDSTKLQQIQVELAAARDDFKTLHTELTNSVYVVALNSSLPKYASSILALAQIGTDATDIGQALTTTAIHFAPALRSSPLATSTEPLVTPPMLLEMRSTIEYILPLMKDMQTQTPLLALDIFPISATQRDQLAQGIQLLPSAITDLTQAHDMMDALGWILGVGQPRTFLIQTLDRAELRPTGGFTGQFSELALTGGRMGPINLQNIGIYEENAENPPNVGQFAPSAYRSWWPIANWGLRDSNLSADFPTSARIAIDVYKREFQHSVDGVICFSPFLISRVLAAVGPIYVPEYQETVTAQNLESKLHYYQLDNAGIRKAELAEHNDNADIARKLFTKRVSKMLLDKVRHASVSDLVGITHEMLHALRTRDLQVYVTNTQIENLLIQYDAAGVVDRSTTHDGLFVVQANVDANKGSQYVQTLMHDTVVLDANGGATHSLQIRLVYHQIDQVYGLDTYHDYVRVYVPPTAKFLGGNGFEQLGIGTPVCGYGTAYGKCKDDAYGNGDLLCPAGQSDPMAETDQANNANHPYDRAYHPLNQEGPPTNMISDEPQRAMYGGWVIMPKNCTATVSLSWYVPPMGHDAYNLLVQRQSGSYPELDLTILPTPSSCAALKTTGKYFNTVLSRDQSFSLVAPNTEDGAKTNCYEQPKV